MFSSHVSGQELAERVEADGYFVLADCLDAEYLSKMRAELSHMLDLDEAARGEDGSPVYLSREGIKSDLTPPMHNILFPAFECQLLSETIFNILEAPIIRNMLSLIIGENYRIRVDLIRRSTGVDDYCDPVELPHPWHRDSPGEFTFGFFLDDFTDLDSGATAIIPGTHWNEYNPVWDYIIGPNSRVTKEKYGVKIQKTRLRELPNDVYSRAVANMEVRSEFARKRTAMRGKIGDLFFFLNDTYHGRWPNRTGEKKMLVRFGAFSSVFPFKADLALPPVFHNGSMDFVGRYNPSRKPRAEGNTFLEKLSSNRRQNKLFDEACAEKKRLVDEFAEHI